MKFREQHTQEVCGTHGRGIERDGAHVAQLAAVREEDAEHGAVAAHRDIVHKQVAWIAQRFECRHERRVEFAGGEHFGERGRMIENHRAVVRADERA